MFSAGPPEAPADDRPFGLVRAARRAFGGPAGLAANPAHRAALRTYLTDLVRPHGLALREDLLAEGPGWSYAEMAEALVGEATREDEPVDLLVLAMAGPDVQPGRATATYLSHVCPGGPLAFAICDQGAATAFTGLRLIREYARTGGCRRALLLVAEQSTMYHEPALPVTVPLQDTTVALILDDRAGDAGSRQVEYVRQHVDVAPNEVGALFTKELDDLPAGSTVVLGAALASYVDPVGRDGVEVRTAAAGQPATGPWWELVTELDRPERRSVVLAEYDPMVRYLGLAAFTI